MAKDVHPLQPQQAQQEVSYRPPYRHVASAGALRAALIGTAIGLVLIAIEALVWFIAFHRLPAFWWVALLAQVVICALLALALRKPLALSRYAREVMRSTERYRTVYTPLPDWLALYASNITCYQHSPDPALPERVQELTLLDLVRPGNQFLVDPQEHLVLLGATGAGKTTTLYFFQFMALLRRRPVIFGRQKIPVYIPLRNYSLFLRTYAGWYEQEASFQPGIARLLDFLSASDMPGIHHIRPYLRRLADQGRLLLLYDGLHDVEESYLPHVITEMVELMSQSRSRVVVSCRQEDYLRQPQLEQGVEANLVARAIIEPLTEAQARGMVERYIESESSGKKWRHTAGQIMDMISNTRLRSATTTPLMMLALLSVIDGIGIERGRRLDTRGRLMRAYTAHLISQAQKRPAWQKRAPAEKDVLLFLGEIAIAARWSNTPLALQLHEHEHLLRVGQPSLEQHADALHGWLGEHIDDLFLTDNLHETYTREDIHELLAFALDAALLEISPHGILSFRHEMFAAYAVAETFATLQATYDTPMQSTSFAGLLALAMKREDTTDAYARWSLPLALWAGQLDDPGLQAQRFIDYGRGHPAATLDMLALALLCIGVASAPPYVAQDRAVTLPPGFEELVSEVLQDGSQRVALARAITRHAEEDAQEIYQALFLLLMLPDIDELIILLDMEVVPALLFRRLRDIVDDSAYDAQVKRLARVLGYLGAVSVPQAAALSRSDAGGSPRLRAAAINILGGTAEPAAVAALHACLYDQDPVIVGRAVNAMIRLGPELTLPALVEELENRAPTSATPQIHAAALRILEHFLKETHPDRELADEQRRVVMGILSHILQGGYAPEVQQSASEMLVQQGRGAGESAAGEMAVDVFIENLASTDEQVASDAARALREIGAAATPTLLKALRESPPPALTARIVQTLGRVRDPRSLSALLRLLADPSPVVQHQVSQALQHFAPDSIPGLIHQVLHGEDDLVATGAEQILVEIGRDAVGPVIEALMPVIPGRTHMLVHMLALVHDMEALPTLIALLQTEAPPAQAPEQVDQQLVVSLIQALGQFQDERVVAPLIDMLASANPLPLFYEEAVNALSSLGEVACDALIAALDNRYEQTITSRIERALLGMMPFPGQRLLAVYDRGSEAQAQHVTNIFVSLGPEAAQLLVSHLIDPHPRVQEHVRAAADQMPGQAIVPALLDVIDHPDPAWRDVVKEYLLRNPREAIPPLVGLLDDPSRGSAAQALLLAFGLPILPALMGGLDSLSSLSHERSRALVVELARESPQGLSEVVQLFAQTPPVPDRARKTLIALLAHELADISAPVLLNGLEDAHLLGDVSETLIEMVKQGDARGELVLEALLDALRVPARRHGAEITLVQIGAPAVPGIGTLVTDDDPEVAQSAQNILCEMGTPAFSFIWAAHSDVSHPERRAAARAIFSRMPTVIIKDELVQLLSSDSSDDIAMALTLLLERIHDEETREPEMIPVLLEHAQTHSDQRASLRILALLILLGGRSAADSLERVLYDFPNHSRIFLYAFLLLGGVAEETLLEMLHDPDTPPLLRAEAAGILGVMEPRMDIREYAKMLADYGLWAGHLSQGHIGILQPDQLNIALRALGGLLTGGYWNVAELQQLRAQSQESSPEHELYDILLGWRYSPYIDSLESKLDRERQEHQRRVNNLNAELLTLHTTNQELEEELQGLHHEHGKRSRELEEATETAGKLSDSLERAEHDKQDLLIEIERLTDERDRLAARNAYLEQVISELQE